MHTFDSSAIAESTCIVPSFFFQQSLFDRKQIVASTFFTLPPDFSVISVHDLIWINSEYSVLKLTPFTLDQIWIFCLNRIISREHFFIIAIRTYAVSCLSVCL